MDPLEQFAEEAAQRFTDRARSKWKMTEGWLRSEPMLRRYSQLVEDRLRQFPQWGIDRNELLHRLRRRFAGREWAATSEAAAAELQEVAREDLCRYLIDNGVAPEDARKIAWSYSIGALLHGD